eukprot:365778-Chlamydomonas_euryale.AAC.11
MSTLFRTARVLMRPCYRNVCLEQLRRITDRASLNEDQHMRLPSGRQPASRYSMMRSLSTSSRCHYGWPACACWSACVSHAQHKHRGIQLDDDSGVGGRRAAWGWEPQAYTSAWYRACDLSSILVQDPLVHLLHGFLAASLFSACGAAPTWPAHARRLTSSVVDACNRPVGEEGGGDGAEGWLEKEGEGSDRTRSALLADGCAAKLERVVTP